jgi:hypothetical protein
MNSKLKPAIIGGVVLGLLSAIPFVNFLNTCCCLWAILGGLLASYLYIRESPLPARTGDGAIMGLLAGAVGAAIYIVVGIPLSIVMGGFVAGLVGHLMENIDPAQAESVRRQVEASQTVLRAIINGIITAILLVAFSTIGGLIGIPLFEKRKGAISVPPPPAL